MTWVSVSLIRVLESLCDLSHFDLEKRCIRAIVIVMDAFSSPINVLPIGLHCPSCIQFIAFLLAVRCATVWLSYTRYRIDYYRRSTRM